MIWQILKIAPTKDKRTITRAYRDLLTSVNPEEKPEEFKLLRSAYEEALAYAAKEEEPVVEKTPVEVWSDQLAQIYHHLPSRLDPSCWKKLLSQDVCIALDTRPDIEEALFRFILEYYRLPQTVWILLNEEFGFTEELDRLFETYPGDFLRYVLLPGIQEREPVPFELFAEATDGRTCDTYIQTYIELDRADGPKTDELMQRLNALPTKHPYGDALCCRIRISKGDVYALETMRAIYDAHSEEDSLLSDLAVCLYQADEYKEVVERVDQILEKESENILALRLKAYSLAELKDYSRAAEIINNLMSLMGGNQRRLADLQRTLNDLNEKLIEQNRQKLEEGAEDPSIAFELVWAYLQNGMQENAYEILPKLCETHPTKLKYLRTCFLVQNSTGRKEEALATMNVMLQEAASEEEVARISPEKMKKWKYRFADIQLEYCDLLLSLNRREEAMEALHIARKYEEVDAEIVTRIGQIFLEEKLYEDAYTEAEKLTEVAPNSYHGYLLKARAAYAMHRDNQAFQAVNEALELEGSDLYPYLLKLKILVRNNAFEPAQQLIDFLKENGVTEDPTLRWCEVQMIPEGKDEDEKALAMYQAIDDDLMKLKEQPEWLSQFYYQMSIRLANVKDARKDYTREDIHAILDKGLAADPEDFDCLDYKAWLLARDNHDLEAMELYLKLEKMPRRNLYIEKQLTELFYKQRFHFADKAYEYQLKLEPDEGETRNHYTRLGHCAYLQKQFDQAEEYYKKALEFSPDEPWIYFLMTENRIVSRDVEKAHEYARKALELHKKAITKKDQRREHYWRHLAQVLCLLNRTDEAIEVYKDCKKNCSEYDTYWDDVADVLQAAGLWEECEEHLKEWKSSGEKPELWNEVRITSDLLTRNLLAVDQLLADSAFSLTDSKRQFILGYRHALEGDFSHYITMREQDLPEEDWENEGGLCHRYESTAIGYWMQGDMEKAVELAEKGLEHFNQYQEKFDLCVPVHTGAASVCLAILGKFQEARDLVKQMETSPMCWMCRYSVCKDQFLYSAEIELVAGNDEKAREYLEIAHKVDPSEEGVLLCEGYLKNKNSSRRLGSD